MEDPIKEPGVEASHMEKKAKRRRLKKLCSQIREQMEFYFSDSNLHKDRFIKQKINESKDGYVDLQIFANFNRLRQLTTDMGLVEKALSTSTLLEFNDDKKKLRRTKPIEEPKDIDNRTVYVEYIPPSADHDWVRGVFTQFGNITYVSLPRYRTSGDMKGFAFVEFETVDGAAKACEAYNNEAILPCRPGRFPRANKQMKLLERQIEEKHNDGFPGSAAGETEETSGGKKKRCKRASNDASNTGPASVCGACCVSPCGKPCKRRHMGEDDEEEVVVAKNVALSDDSGLRDDVRCTHNDNDNDTADPEQDEKRAGGTTLEKEETVGSKSKEGGELSSEATTVVSNKDLVPGTIGSDKDLVPGSDKDLVPGGLKRKASGDEGRETKKVRISEDVQIHSAHTTDGAGQTTKQHRHRQKAPVKELPELRVMPKSEWVQLKKEYLDMQQRNMHKLKETLKQLRTDEQRHIELAAEKKSKPKVEYAPSVILKVTSQEPITRKQLKAHVEGTADVAYIDLVDGDTEGNIRCRDSDSCEKIVTMKSEQFTFTLLIGVEEENYWNKLASDREKKLNSKTKNKKRGRDKVTEKAEKAAAKREEKKHTFFDEDDE